MDSSHSSASANLLLVHYYALLAQLHLDLCTKSATRKKRIVNNGDVTHLIICCLVQGCLSVPCKTSNESISLL